MKRRAIFLAFTCWVTAQSPPRQVEVVFRSTPTGAQVWWNDRSSYDFLTGQKYALLQGPHLFPEVSGYPVTIRKQGFRERKLRVSEAQLHSSSPVVIEVGELQPVTLRAWLEVHPWLPWCAGLVLLGVGLGGLRRHQQKLRQQLLEQVRRRQVDCPQDEYVGRTLGDYFLLERLGSGGMATVYRAVRWQSEPDREVALKLLKTPQGISRDLRLRYSAEVRLGAQLRHPNIVLLYEPLEVDQEIGLVMELLQGGPLRKAPQPLAPALRQIGSALGYLHQRGIVHRDLKPENLFLTEQGVLKLMDFGISTQAGQPDASGLAGTLAYMAPEVISGQPAGPPADQYALGIMVYLWLTGQLPFADETARGLALQHLQVDPVPPSYLCPQLDPSLDEVLLKLLAKAPEARYVSIELAVEQLIVAIEKSALEPKPDVGLDLSPTVAE
jgi:hypothetical protein